MIQEQLRSINKKLDEIMKYCKHNGKVHTTLYNLITITWIYFSLRDNQ